MSFWSRRSTQDGCGSRARRFELVCAVLLALNWQAAQAQNCTSTPVTKGYRDFNFGSTVFSTPTAEKPEHKLWYTDDFWWGSLWDPSVNKYRIHRFDRETQCWTSVGPDIDDRPQTLADALWEDEKLYIASHVSELTSATGNARLYRYSYNESANTYSLDSGFPVDINNVRSETLTIEKEGNNGRLWITYVAGSKVMVNHSTTDDLHWATPFQMPVQGSNVGSDDISAIVKMNSKIGVMWSNQSDKKMYFAVHKNVDSPTVWQTRETALSDGSKPVGDDHINLKLHSDEQGNMYAVTKSSTSSSSETLIYLLRRSDGGVWSTYEVAKKSDNHTRPILALDTQNRIIHVFMARLSGNPRCIYRKSTGMDNIQFTAGLGEEFIRSESDGTVNDPTTTRQNLNSKTGILILASDENSRNYLHGYMPIAGNSSNLPPTANASATPQSGAAPLQVSFSSSGSNDPEGSPLTYSWNFGNGNISSEANPTHTYNAVGNFNAVLTVTDNRGATDTDNISISVTASGNQPPLANASATPQNGTAPLQVSFSSSGSNDPDGSISSYSWDFGYGNISSSAHPTHTYNTPGAYEAVLTVTDNQGASAEASVNISVTPLGGGGDIVTFNPFADAQVNSSSPGRNYGALETFRIRSDSPLYRCYVKFNVTGLTGPTARATLRLFVTDNGPNGGTLHSVSNNYTGTNTPWVENGLNFNNAPAISGTPIANGGAAPLNSWIEFDVTSAINGNGTFSFGLNPNSTNSVFFSTKEGENAPQLVIETSSGGGNQSPNANASAAPQNGTAPLQVSFSSSGSNDPDGNIAAHAWNFGDGNSSSAANPTHTYNAAGNYTATLTVTDNQGATGTANVSINVTTPSNQPPIANASATPQNGTAPLQVSFSSSGSNDPDGNIAAHAWNFGDGNSSSAANPTHTYNAAGNYTATLTVTDNQGATGTANISINVTSATNQPPVAHASATPQNGTEPLQVSFSSSGSNDPDGNIASYSWNFGDGNSASAANPTHTYNAAGEYNAVLTVTDNQGAHAEASVSISVAPVAGGGETMTFIPTDDGHVNSSNATRSYGEMNTFRIRGGSPTYFCYMKFNVAGFAGQVARATLRMYVLDNGPDAGALYLVSNNYKNTNTPWIENGVNWNNAPAMTGSPVSSPGAAPLNAWVEFDVTSVITGNGTFSFGLSTNSTNSVYFSTKEGDDAPQLVIESASSGLAATGNLPPLAPGTSNTSAEGNEQVDLSSADAASDEALTQNFPNPFNPSTNIAFTLTEEGRVTLHVYDVLGSKVATLVNGVRSAGRHTATFDASHLPTGTYYYVLQVGETRFVKRLSFVK